MTQWSFAKRFGFRFVFAYFLLYTLPFPLDVITFGKVPDPMTKLWDALVPLAAHNILHVAADVKPNGSGDTTWNYVQLFCMVALALIAASIWSVLDRKRPSYTRLCAYLHVYVRFTLAAAMFSYGLAKVIPSQFPQPSLDRLVEPYGSSSPMGVLWAFMGTSVAYSIFAGAAECLGGLLLVPRRTMLLGALISAGVMSNIVALNFCYDVPVKLYSVHLLLMAVFVAAPGVRRLLEFFVLTPVDPLFRDRRAHIASIVFRTLLIGTLIVLAAQQSIGYVRQTGSTAGHSPLRGVWNVDVLEVDGVPRPPLVTDATRWRRFVFDIPNYTSIYLMSDTRVRYMVQLDEKKKSLAFTNRDKPQETFGLTYARPDAQTLQLDGTVEGRKIHAVCKLADAKNFLLLNRGFHWINEYPFNR
jgi:hypothetical protein